MIGTKRLLLGGMLPAIAIFSLGSANPPGTAGTEQPAAPALIVAPIERLDPGLNAILSPEARIEGFASGFTWTEGPVWIHAGYLLFAEITSNSIRRLGPDGQVTIFLQPTGYAGKAAYGGPEPGSNGMTLDRSGRLTVAGHAGRTVWRLESLQPGATRTILADSFAGKALNSPNDLVYRSDGSLYFTDPPYGLRTQGDTDPDKQQTINGVYRVPAAEKQAPGSAPDRAHLQLLVKDLPRPNGLAFSPDEKYLYVDNSQPKKLWMRYPVHQDGTLGPGKVFFDASADTRPGSPDGIKVDRSGNVYTTGPGGLWIFSPAGKHLGTIPTPKNAANLAWGGPDGKTLYVTASDQILRIQTKIGGIEP
jgi:gluconolactonase